ncbi:adenylate cyclase type 2 [Eurytemora carolleeae]|uniref:adenylate cyclase type 2 n=1 Tax=Eurytemora carolleeae TaxID=1294199 RepID=UPI000C786E2A|nr:adenylate cyclase type 2 [Eurytemora carolleeae]|eukprot:XP_023347771.1 adenylate cyclase type 2-like [Eurytemora affinis]
MLCSCLIITSSFLQTSTNLYNLVLLWIPLLVLITLDRDQDLTSRMEWMWRETLRGEEEEVETMQGINRVLLENLLPAHVASHYLSIIKGNGTEELYSHRYENVSVMFASIPNYKEFYNENDINKQGLECIRLLNEIICDFDLLLSKPKFSCIEKIKTIGSSYMVAAGLTPGQSWKKEAQRESHVAIVMVEFAHQLMQLLDNINRDSFQVFLLRVGASTGPVVAGVVGARKPQYDIWGNTVNVASRMETTGQMGRIQVTESFADKIKDSGITCSFRGKIQVKGKGSLPTYWIDKPSKLNIGGMLNTSF